MIEDNAEPGYDDGDTCSKKQYRSMDKVVSVDIIFMYPGFRVTIWFGLPFTTCMLHVPCIMSHIIDASNVDMSNHGSPFP